MTYLPPTKNGPVPKNATPDTQASDGSDAQTSSGSPLAAQVREGNAANSFHRPSSQESSPDRKSADASTELDDSNKTGIRLRIEISADTVVNSPGSTPSAFRGRSSHRGSPRTPSTREEMTAYARLSRSASPSLAKGKAIAAGYAPTSPYARMNNATFEPDFQRRFFQKRAVRHGYVLAAEDDALPEIFKESETTPGNVKDETVWQKWKSLALQKDPQNNREARKQKKARKKFFEARNNHTKNQRIAFALTVARLIARDQSNRVRGLSQDYALREERISILGQEINELETSGRKTDDDVFSPRTPEGMRDKAAVSDVLSGESSHAAFDSREAGVDARSANDSNYLTSPDASANRSRFEFTQDVNSKTFADFNQTNSGPTIGTDSPGSIISRRSLIDDKKAELKEKTAAQDGSQSKLEEAGINRGKSFLKDFLSPNATNDGRYDPEYNMIPNELISDEHRLAWTPCRNEDEVNQVINFFDVTCASYNKVAEKRLKAADEQNRMMKDSVLPRLAMPVELRGSTKAEEIRKQAAQDFATERGWDAPLGWRDFFRVSGAILGTVLGLGFPLLNARWYDFVCMQFFHSYRMKKVEAYANAQQIQELKQRNQDAAEEWVNPPPIPGDNRNRSRYRTPDLNALAEALAGLEPEPEHISDLPPENPAGLISEIQSELTPEQRRAQLVDEIQKQLVLAVRGDILGETEKRAEELNALVTDSLLNVPDKNYRLDEEFLGEMAEGILEGLIRGCRHVELEDGYLADSAPEDETSDDDANQLPVLRLIRSAVEEEYESDGDD